MAFVRKKRAPALNNELFNTISHTTGAGLALVGLVALLLLAAWRRETVYLMAFGVYGVTLVLLYVASSIYHFYCHVDHPRLRQVFQRLDHGAIYLLIAGSYTPICLGAIGGSLGWAMFGGVWALAGVGILMKIFQKDPDNPLSFLLYLVMGWMAVLGLGPLRQAMEPAALRLLFAGGLAYTLGAVIYATRKPRLWPGRFSHHELWHVLVMLGSGLHYALMVVLVV